MTEAAPTVVLEARSLYRFFRAGDEETLALQGVSLAVARGEFVAVTGPSGSGKSTLLACLAGMDDPDGGHVTIAGQRVSHRSERQRADARASYVGMLFQSGNLIEHLTVAQNLSLARSFATSVEGVSGDELLRRTGIRDRADAYPSELSGGELARAGLAVALVNGPSVLIADEPTGELDTDTEAQVLDLLISVTRDGVAVVVASHSSAVAAAASRVLRLDDGRLRE